MRIPRWWQESSRTARLGVLWSVIAVGGATWRHFGAARPGWVAVGVASGETVWVDTLPVTRAGSLGAEGFDSYAVVAGPATMDPWDGAPRFVDVRCPAGARETDEVARMVASAVCRR